MKVYFDLDETLIETHFWMEGVADTRDDFVFTLDGDPTQYRTQVRPTAREVVGLARELFGEENVFILTTSTEDYSGYINRKAELGFKPEQIFPREKIKAFKKGEFKPEKSECVLIDNLPPIENWDKLYFLDIRASDYLKVDNYKAPWPEDTPEELEEREKRFFDDVKTFLYQFKNSA